MPQAITAALVRRLKPTPDGRRVTVSDSTVRGFVAACHPSGRVSFYAQASVRGKGVLRRLIGHADVMTPEDARRQASEWLRLMRYEGVDPYAARVIEVNGGRTFGAAMDHLMEVKSKSRATTKYYTQVRDRLLAEWKNRPLRELGHDRAGWLDAFDRIKRDSGESSAALTMTIARAAYRRAQRLVPTLPSEPWAAIEWPKSRKRTTKLLEGDNLRTWAMKVAACHPSKRDLLLAMAFTFVRVGAATVAMNEHLHLDEDYLLVPRSKTLVNFRAALGRHAKLVLERSARRTGGEGLLFPSPRKRQPYGDPRVAGSGARPHDLRRLGASIAAELHIAQPIISKLLGHAPNGVTEAHYTNSIPHEALVEAADRIGCRIVERMGPEAASLLGLD